MDRGAWWATACGVTESQTWLSMQCTIYILECIGQIIILTKKWIGLIFQKSALEHLFWKELVEKFQGDSDCLSLGNVPTKASLMAQTVKNPPAMRETWVQSLCWDLTVWSSWPWPENASVSWEWVGKGIWLFFHNKFMELFGIRHTIHPCKAYNSTVFTVLTDYMWIDLREFSSPLEDYPFIITSHFPLPLLGSL